MGLSAICALFGALLGAIGGDALGAEAWITTSIAALANESVASFLSNYVNATGGSGTFVGIIIGTLSASMIDTFRGEESVLGALTGLVLLAITGAIVAAIGGADVGAGCGYRRDHWRHFWYVYPI